MNTPIPLIIDTDVALGVHHEGRPRDIDDGFAIAEALNSPLLDLRLVSTVFGNAPQDAVFQVANEIIALKGAATPVLRGASTPMAKDESTNDAVEGMARLLRQEPCAIAAIGPLTNMGLLARHHPDAFARITQLIIVAGRSEGARFFIGDAGPVQDFNFENDVAAAQLMLASAAPGTRVVSPKKTLRSLHAVGQRLRATSTTGHWPGAVTGPRPFRRTAGFTRGILLRSPGSNIRSTSLPRHVAGASRQDRVAPRGLSVTQASTEKRSSIAPASHRTAQRHSSRMWWAVFTELHND